MIYIYTDGSCLGNPGFGGWAAIINDDGEETVLAGTESSTTNNRMELMAAIKALESLVSSKPAVVLSDSRYLVNTMTKGWKRKANQDLWQALDSLVSQGNVRWQWVQGHSGDVNNERVDKLANDIAKQAQSMATKNSNEQEEVTVFSHIDGEGKVVMVDVEAKKVTERVAVASGKVSMHMDTFKMITSGTMKKGDLLGVAKVAGINAAKHTWELIPLCHNIPLSHVELAIDYDLASYSVDIVATVKASGRTGVEMEALTAVAVAGLTIYDMVKAIDREIELKEIRLISKSGGKTGDWVRPK